MAPGPHSLRCTLLGVGAMRSPCFAPAGLLIEYRGHRVALDGGAAPLEGLSAWLVTDAQAELIAQLRRLTRGTGVEPQVGSFIRGPLAITARRVVHTSHPAFGYEIRVPQGRVVWAPEFLRFPRWAAGADLMFAEAAAFSRPILFAGKVGGHATVQSVCRTAARLKIRRLVLAHIGRPTLRALAAGWQPELGELGEDGAIFLLDASGRVRRLAPQHLPATRRTGLRPAEGTAQPPGDRSPRAQRRRRPSTSASPTPCSPQ